MKNQSFAGMFNSVLDVPKADLEKAIKIVGDSVTNSRVLAYVKHFKTKRPRMAVVLQKFKEPQFSGVWIGKEINAGYLEWTNGNGEKLVSGRIKPTSENWPSESDKVLKVKDKAIGESCLEVQTAFNSLADLEWCILDDELVWLQYRPVTKRINREESVDIPDAYDGVAASSGIVQGKPIYLEGTSDSDAFEDGAILLTDYTDPDWVPIMMKSSAIITAEGGFLSHTAIICRELGIPCVTGLGYDVIENLSKASMIEVNGSSGKVKKLDMDKRK